MLSEEAKELKQSILWTSFVGVLQEDIEKLKEQLINCQVPDKVIGIQREIRTLRSVIQRPDAIIEAGE